MALTVTDPPPGAPMGYGQGILAHSSTPRIGAETLQATLVWIDPGNVPRAIAAGSGVISSGSSNAHIVFGVTYFGTWNSLGAVDPRGAPLGALLNVDFIRRSPAGATLESATLTDYFLHDPVSQLANLLNQWPPGHDPMLDTILAALVRSWS